MSIKRRNGSLSVDFLISISVSCLLLIFAILISLTFSLVEVAQYVAYTTAREYFIGHNTYDEHRNYAKDRYAEVTNGKFFPKGKALSEWFFVSPADEISFYENPNSNFNIESRTRFGIGLTFTSKVMTMNIPFLGSVGDSSSKTGGFDFPIAAFLGREVSTQECKDIMGDFASGGNGC